MQHAGICTLTEEDTAIRERRADRCTGKRFNKSSIPQHFKQARELPVVPLYNVMLRSGLGLPWTNVEYCMNTPGWMSK